MGNKLPFGGGGHTHERHDRHSGLVAIICVLRGFQNVISKPKLGLV